MILCHIIFKGNVQGVGFRATTAQFANDLGLKGTVKNLLDNTVEVYVQGEPKKIEQLITHLKEFFGKNIYQVEIRESVSKAIIYTHFNVI